jgi:NADPH-dependent 2,4-dienoyl-CoA reductase/sulfur reductase-like enzyme/rhodanese-related sulfurtransferase
MKEVTAAPDVMVPHSVVCAENEMSEEDGKPGEEVSMSQEAQNVLVIGGVACGPKTAARVKRLQPKANVTLIEKTGNVSFGACGIPYYLEGHCESVDTLYETPVGVKRTPDFFQKTKGFTVQVNTEAQSIDRENKQVKVKDHSSGQERDMAYDKLVLATGSRPFVPPIPGIDKQNIWSIKSSEDAEGVAASIDPPEGKKAVIIGAGLIGVEMAEALKQRGMEVTIVEMFDQIMPQILDYDLATLAAKHIRSNGVNLALGEQVVGFTGQDKVTGVQTKNTTFDADVVIVSVGVRPNDELAREAGLECHPKGGIRINCHGQTSDPEIYAGGDCAINDSILSYLCAELYVPLGSTANKHGRVIANHICGQTTPFSGVMSTSICKVFGMTLGRTGISHKQAENLGYEVESALWTGPDKPHYMPDGGPISIKLVASKRNRALLGAQVLGTGDAAKRLDVATAAVHFKANLDDVGAIDISYAPPFSPPIDPLITASHVLTNKMDGLANGLLPMQAKEIMDSGKDIILLDVRTPQEFAAMRMPDDRVVHIPLGQLRERLQELPKDKDILAFCKVSMRGYEAQRVLQDAGFDRVWFIEGGLVGWPFEVEMSG